MDLLRHWRRGTFGMAAGALVVPGAILMAALAVGIGGGGLASLGALRQALNGPDLPSAVPAAQHRPARDSSRLLARVNRRAAAQARAAAAARRTAARPTAGDGPLATIGQPTAQGRFTPAGGGGPTSTGSAPPTATAPPAPPPAPTPAPPSAVRQVGDTVTTVTDQVPVVGPTTSQVVDDVVDTVDAIIPPRRR